MILGLGQARVLPNLRAQVLLLFCLLLMQMSLPVCCFPEATRRGIAGGTSFKKHACALDLQMEQNRYAKGSC